MPKGHQDDEPIIPVRELFRQLRAEWSAPAPRAVEMEARRDFRATRSAARAKPRPDVVEERFGMTASVAGTWLKDRVGERAAPKLLQQLRPSESLTEVKERQRRIAMERTAIKALEKRAAADERAQKRILREVRHEFEGKVIPRARQRASELRAAVAAGASLADQVDLLARRDFRGVALRNDRAFSDKLVKQHKPSAEEAAREAGISRATWYRRQAKLDGA